jgi:hypothetical protein
MGRESGHPYRADYRPDTNTGHDLAGAGHPVFGHEQAAGIPRFDGGPLGLALAARSDASWSQAGHIATREESLCERVGNGSESTDAGLSGRVSRIGVSVVVAISIEDPVDPAGELRSLRDWLRADDAFGGSADLALSRPGVGEMGAVADTLNVVLGPAEVAALAGALSVWLRTRRSDVKVRVRSGEREVEVDATNVSDPERFVELVREDLA